jgi:hypothetical protein
MIQIETMTSRIDAARQNEVVGSKMDVMKFPLSSAKRLRDIMTVLPKTTGRLKSNEIK